MIKTGLLTLKEHNKKTHHKFFNAKYLKTLCGIEKTTPSGLPWKVNSPDEEDETVNSDIKIFIHHIYEYEKGLRNLVLHTAPAKHRSYIEKKLKGKNIACFIQEINSLKINVFFGNSACIEVIKEFGEKKLCDFNDEEDFILGIMLGYDSLKQCERYVTRKGKKISKVNETRYQDSLSVTKKQLQGHSFPVMYSKIHCDFKEDKNYVS